MRTPFAWALLLLVCACSDGSERPATTTGALASIPAGPDPIVLRVARGGGLVSAVSYPGLDSVVWRSSFRVPALSRVLGYHPDDGYLTAVDTAGRPVRLDLRLGAVAIPGSAGGALHTSADGAVLYAVNVEGDVARYTPVGDRWTLSTSAMPAALVPLNDGSLVTVSMDAERVVLRRVRPPDSVVVDSLQVNIAADSLSVHGMTVGDRMFLSAGSRILSLRTRDFVMDVDVDMENPVRDFVTSPSGDRIFVRTEGRDGISVVDRFAGKVAERVSLPGAARQLRMDALGRVLLVQGLRDSAYVIDIGTSKRVGTVRTEWRGDLPLVLADGVMALLHGDSVTMTSSIDLGVTRTIADGGQQFWYAMRWNGFRPRSAGLDEPVRFRASERRAVSESVGGTLDAEIADTLTGASDARTQRTARDTPDSSVAVSPAPRRQRVTYTVQLAAVLTEELAREAAAGVVVDGKTPRIASSVRDGRTLYRVVLGPYATREQAERAGKSSGRTYWVFEGAP